MTAPTTGSAPLAEGTQARTEAPAHAATEPTMAEVLDRFASPTPAANAALVGVPTFMVGSIALALVLVGFVPQALAGAPIAIIAMATGVGQLIATIFALRAGESAVASIFGIFTGFWLSYAALVLGIVHDWYGLTVSTATGASPAAAAAASGANILAAQKVFLLSWLILVVILTLVSLRLPFVFALLLVLVDVALLFVYLGTVNASATELRIGGILAFGFVAVGAYLFLDAMSVATGGKPIPLGPPILK